MLLRNYNSINLWQNQFIKEAKSEIETECNIDCAGCNYKKWPLNASQCLFRSQMWCKMIEINYDYRFCWSSVNNKKTCSLCSVTIYCSSHLAKILYWPIPASKTGTISLKSIFFFIVSKIFKLLRSRQCYWKRKK